MKKVLLITMFLLVALLFIACEPKETCFQQITTDSISYRYLSGEETSKYFCSADTVVWCDDIIPSNFYTEYEKYYILNSKPVGTPCFKVHHISVEFVEL